MGDRATPEVFRVDGKDIVSTRGRHTPETRARSTLGHFIEHYRRQFGGYETTFEQFFEPLWTEALGATGGDDLLFNTWYGDSEDAAEFRRLHTLDQFAVIVGTAYAIQAIKTYRAGDEGLAWDFALDAAQWDGFLGGRDGIEPRPQPVELPAGVESLMRAPGHNRGTVKAKVKVFRDIKARHPQWGQAKIANYISVTVGKGKDPAIDDCFEVNDKREIVDKSTGESVTIDQLKERIKKALARTSP